MKRARRGRVVRAERPGVRGGGDPRSTMGRLLDGLKDAEYNPHSAVCKLPQPFRMLDKLLSRLVDDAVNLAVERDEARLAARGIAEGTEVLTPSKVVPDVGGVTCVAASADGAWVFAGNDEGELVVVNASSGSVASRTRVLAGSIAAVDAVAVDPPPPPPPRPPTPPPEDTAGEGNEGAEGDDAEGADADADGPKEEVEKEKDEEAPPGDGDDEGGAAALAGLALDDIAAAAGGLSPADLRPLYLVAVAGVGGDVVVVATDPTTGKIKSEWSSTPVVAAGDAPVTRRSDETDDRNDAATAWSPRENAVATARFSPDGTALAVTCGGGALAVYVVAAPPAEAFIVSKDDDDDDDAARRGGDGDGDDGQGRGDAVKEGEGDDAKGEEEGAAEGGEGVAGGGVGREGGKSDVDFVAAASNAPRLKALTWLPADAAASTFGPFHRERDDPGGMRDEGQGGANEGSDSGSKPEMDPNDGGTAGAPTVHFRLTCGRADAAFVTWRGVNRLAMFQLAGATNAPSRLAVVPTLRGESQPAEEPAGSDSGLDSPPVATAPAGDWTLPFPVSAAASGDGGALLALAMIDGSVVLFNARLGAVAKTFRRIGNYGPGLDGYDPTAPPAVHVDDSCVSERTANTPLAIAALSFWTGDASDGARRSLIAATEAGWLAVFDLDAASSRAEVNPSPVTIRPRGDARVPTAGLTCQAAGSLAFACGVEPPASKEGSLGENDDDNDDDDENKREDGENREDDADERREPAEKRSETEEASRDDGDAGEAAATRWFFRLVDLTGGEGSDLPADARSAGGSRLRGGSRGNRRARLRGGEPGGGGIERTPRADEGTDARPVRDG